MVVRNRATMSGQTTDHMRPRIHRATAAISRTSSDSAETRAALRRAAAVFGELSVSDMGLTLWSSATRPVDRFGVGPGVQGRGPVGR